MHIAWTPHSNNPAYAGVRLRCLIPGALLRKLGHRVELDLQGTAAHADVTVVQAKWLLDTGDPGRLLERMSTLEKQVAQGTRLVLDSFDNYFLNESNDPARAAMLEAYRECLSAFSLFVVSSPGLVPFMQDAVGNNKKVVVLGDPVEGPGAHRLYESWLQRSNPRRWPAHLRARLELMQVSSRKRTTRQLLWFGNQGSKYATGGMSELKRVIPHLERAAETTPLNLTVVSNSAARYVEVMQSAHFNHTYREWDRLHFASFLQQQDLVILPSTLNAFTVSKSNNRLLLPLSLGVPVMADALPDYLPWQEYFCLEGWDQLGDVLADLAPWRLRARAAVDLIKQHYSPEAIMAQWQSAINWAFAPS